MPSKEVSLSMTIVLVFLTHGVVNWTLLLPWNSLRCSFWNLYSCDLQENWMLNWLAYSRFHVLTLLVCLVQTSMGNYLLEQRLLVLCSLIMLNYLSTGVFVIEYLNRPMAALQCLIYLALLGLSLHHYTMSTVVPLPSQLRSSSFDMRRKLPLATLSLGHQFVLNLWRVVDMTFGNGLQVYKANGGVGGAASLSSSPLVVRAMAHATVNETLFATLILGGYFLTGTLKQQKALLLGQTIVLFVMLVLLAGGQGESLHVEQGKTGSVTTFFSILISLLGLV